jgi:hypothetical protein
MALQPNLSPGLPFWGFCNNNLFTGLDCSSSAQPPTWRTRPPYLRPPETGWPQALGTHFSRLLWYAWVTVGLFFNPDHHAGGYVILHTQKLIPTEQRHHPNDSACSSMPVVHWILHLKLRQWTVDYRILIFKISSLVLN